MASAESFNGKFRDECLSLEWFRSRAEAKVLIEEWRRHLQRGTSAFEPRLSHAGRVRAAGRTSFVRPDTADQYVVGRREEPAD